MNRRFAVLLVAIALSASRSGSRAQTTPDATPADAAAAAALRPRRRKWVPPQSKATATVEFIESQPTKRRRRDR